MPAMLLAGRSRGARRRIARGLAAFVAVAFEGGAPALAQTVFEGTERVVEVQVPVHVTDQGGRPIRDLAAADFEIVDEGRRREILGFDVFDLELIEPGISRTGVDQSVKTAARRNFLLLFDLSFARPAAVARARVAARKLVLEQLHATDLVAVATVSTERGARLLVTFTTDRAQVARAIDLLDVDDLESVRRRDPLGFLVDDPDAAAIAVRAPLTTGSSGSGGAGGEGAAEQSESFRVLAKQAMKAEQGRDRGRIAGFSRSLESLAELLGVVRGRKQILYFSEGFAGDLLLGREMTGFEGGMDDQRLSVEVGHHWGVLSDDLYGNTGLLAEVERMFEAMKRSDCVIQAVDIAGLVSGGPAEARDRGSRRHALFYLSRGTGGELFEGTNDLGEQLGRVLERTSVTYLLTFSAADVPPDGAWRRLKVRADLGGPGRVVARPGYFAPKPWEAVHPLERELLASQAIAAAEPVSDLAVHLLAAAFPTGGGEDYVPVILEIDGADLLHGSVDHTLVLEIYAYVTDAHGEMRDFFTQFLTLDSARTRRNLELGGLKYYGHLDLGPGDYLIRVLVREATTGRAGLAVRPLHVPAAGTPRLLPPFAVDERTEWLLVREPQDTSGGEIVYPFVLDGQPYVPAALPEIKSGGELRLCLVAYDLPAGGLEAGAVLLDEADEPVPGELRVELRDSATGDERIRRLVAVLRPGDLPAGRYTVALDLRDGASGLAETAVVPLRIVP